MSYTWEVCGDRILCRKEGRVLFSDRMEHWNNGVRRLLNLDEPRARRWAETVLDAAPRPFSECNASERITALRSGTHVAFGLSERDNGPLAEGYASFSVLDRKVDRRWVLGVGDELGVEVIGSADIEHGVLVDRATRQPVKPPAYGEDYFEGRRPGFGYGAYREQFDWRMEKARRYVQWIGAIAQLAGRSLPSGSRVLDAGAGYGFFRAAAADQGWIHDGEDVSAYAACGAEALFGFHTFVGTLSEFAAQTTARYDVITLFDSIEHCEDPESFMRAVVGLLAPGGLSVLRTPNIRALEFDIFGRYYHSLKLEHLHYFSPTSLCHLFERVGLIPEFLTTESHLFAGFLGNHLPSLRQQLRGSDLFAAASKP